MARSDQPSLLRQITNRSDSRICSVAIDSRIRLLWRNWRAPSWNEFIGEACLSGSSGSLTVHIVRNHIPNASPVWAGFIALNVWLAAPRNSRVIAMSSPRISTATRGRRKHALGSVLVGALLYVKGRTIPQLVVELAKRLRLPEGIRHCWIVDRGIISRSLCRELEELGEFVLGRMRSNQVVYFAPEETETGGRPRLYGEKCRVDQLLQRFLDRLRQHKMKLRVYGQTRTVDVYSAEILLRGVWRGRAFPARIIIVVVPELAIKPWYLLSTDLKLDPCEAVSAYDGRYQIEVNFDEVKELGLGHYQGRSAQGVRRWPLFLSAVHTILKLIATGKTPAVLPTLNWEWYEHEDTVGQVRRRIIEHCRPPLSRTKGATASLK
jgi:hypothetical protein